MIPNNIYRISLFVLCSFLMQACVEPIEFETKNFESALVIEGTITDQLNSQEILLSRTFTFEENGPAAESNADVRVLDDSGNIFSFEEVSPGRYLSESEFKAVSGRTYQLLITTADGGDYASEAAQLTKTSEITDVYARRATSADGTDGVAIFVDGKDPTGSSSYYRYEYEETYKQISPIETNQDLIVEDDQLQLVPKIKEERICYNTEESNRIILANTTSLGRNEVEGFLINFIPRRNPVISHRYSVLVKQYVISRDAYAFYETLKELSEAESLFSQNQPGFLNGNIYSEQNPEEKVIGYFSVASEVTHRIFMNYEDFFGTSDGKGPFVENCSITRPSVEKLKELLQDGRVKFLEPVFDSAPNEEGDGPYRVVPVKCVDCTTIGNNVAPDFWEE